MSIALCPPHIHAPVLSLSASNQSRTSQAVRLFKKRKRGRWRFIIHLPPINKCKTFTMIRRIRTCMATSGFQGHSYSELAGQWPNHLRMARMRASLRLSLARWAPLFFQKYRQLGPPLLFEGGNGRAPALALSWKGRLSHGDFKSKGKREGPPLFSFTPKGGCPVSSFALQKGAPWIGQKCRESPKVKGKGARLFVVAREREDPPLSCVRR